MAISRDASAAEVRAPAEFEPHAATWLCRPHGRENWPDDLDEALDEFDALVRTLADSEPVHVLCDEPGPAVDGVHWHRAESDDAWLRDSGPTFVERAGTLVALDWGFDGWGGKYPHARDARLAARVAELAGIARRAVPGFVTEGGSLDVDGRGTLLVNPRSLRERNPGLDPERIDAHLHEELGVRRVIFVEGSLAGDDTDGHVDNLARFVAPGRVVFAVPEAGESLRGERDAAGREIERIALPEPPVVEREGARLPASYANFYVANRVVVVPQFGVASDTDALHVLTPLFPQRSVVGLSCRALVAGLGGFHCLTQPQPRL